MTDFRSMEIEGIEDCYNIVFPFLQWTWTVDGQKCCAVQIHLPSGWIQENLLGAHVDEDGHVVHIEFSQMDCFFNYKRLKNKQIHGNKLKAARANKIERFKNYVKTVFLKNSEIFSPRKQKAMNSNVGYSDTKVKHRMSIRLPFPCEKMFKEVPEFCFYNHPDEHYAPLMVSVLEMELYAVEKPFYVKSVKPHSRAIQINFDEDSDDDEDDRRNSKADNFFYADAQAEQMHDDEFLTPDAVRSHEKNL